MRHTKSVTITTEGRDKGKIFVLVEMPAMQAEEWAMRALAAIAKNSDIPAGLSNAGMLGIFIMGLKPVLAAPFELVKPLLDEMFASCLSHQPDAENPGVLRGKGIPGITAVGPLVPEDIEEVSTRVMLRDAIFELHTGFSPAAVLSQSWGKVLAVADFMNTQASAAPSGPSSQNTPA